MAAAHQRIAQLESTESATSAELRQVQQSLAEYMDQYENTEAELRRTRAQLSDVDNAKKRCVCALVGSHG